MELQLEPDKCLRVRTAANICDNCVKVCPSQAIEISNGFRIDKEKCDACGLCAGTCPTEALMLDQHSYHQLIGRAREKRKIAFTCEQNPLLGVINLPCLGYLSETLLIGLVLNCNRIRLVFAAEKCASCNRQAGALIEERLIRVQAMASRLGKEGVLLVDHGEEEEVLTKREFFSFLKDRIVTLTYSGWEDKRTRKGKKLLPAAREFLLNSTGQSLKTGSQLMLSGSNWPFAQIEVDERCTGCQVCTQICPTGALQMNDDDEEKELRHTPALCLNCGACADYCPQQAVSQGDKVDLGKVVAATSFPLRKIHQKRFWQEFEPEFLHRSKAKKLLLKF